MREGHAEKLTNAAAFLTRVSEQDMERETSWGEASSKTDGYKVHVMGTRDEGIGLRAGGYCHQRP